MLKYKVMDKEVDEKIKELKAKEKEENRLKKRLKVHSSNLSELKGELRRTIELNSMMHGLLLLLGLIMKDFIKTSK
jgi:hypothetical protein